MFTSYIFEEKFFAIFNEVCMHEMSVFHNKNCEKIIGKIDLLHSKLYLKFYVNC